MGTSNRERRAAKQRRRDQKRGHDGAPGPQSDRGQSDRGESDRGQSDRGPADRGPADRGLSAEALRRVLADTGTDLAAGQAEALTELRHLLTEHLARRREHVLTACDEVLADPPNAEVPDRAPDLDAVLGRAGELATALAEHLDAGGTVASWADATGATAEIAAVATVGVLARRL